MRVAVLGSAAAVHTRRWSAALAERGFEVRVYSLEPAPPGASGAGEALVMLPAWPLPGVLRYPLAARPLARALREFAPDLVDAHFVPNYGLLGALAGRRPLTVNCWGSDLLAARDPLRRARARWVLARAARVFVDADNLARAARELGVEDGRLAVVPWGVDTTQFAFSAEDAARRRARAAWPQAWLAGGRPQDPVVVSTRVLHAVYDVETLVRAWPHVARSLPRARCLVAGDGPRRGALAALAARNGAAGSLCFLGRLAPEELPRLLAGADAYVSTSLSDSTSLSLLEAMSAGAFPVVTGISGNREWVGETTAGLFPPRDAFALARALVAVLRDPGGRSAARAANRRTVEERGDRRRAMDRVAREFRALAAAQGEPGSPAERPPRRAPASG
jgi:glycosyltransferase involved in cell wall biosynthesis